MRAEIRKAIDEAKQRDHIPLEPAEKPNDAYEITYKGHTCMDIPLANTCSAQVDIEDWERVKQYRWFGRRGTRTWYVRAKINGKPVELHRFILGLTDSSIHVDHINGDGLNCCRWNLRIATPQQNSANCRKQRRKTTSRYKGVTRDKGRWRAQIRVSGKVRHLGTFETEELAALAYNEAAKEAFGEFAKPNFIRGARKMLPPRCPKVQK